MLIPKMGQDQSIDDIEFSHEDGEQKTQAGPLMCPHCQDKVAKYRCKMIIDDMSKVMRYQELVEYWDTRLREEKGEYILAFVGCESCMSETSKPYFTYITDGWTDGLFIEDEYELTTLKR